MASVALVREALRDRIALASDAHPGLLLAQGYRAHDPATTAKAEHVWRVCAIPASALYSRAYERWVGVTADPSRFDGLVMRLPSRLLTDLSAGAALETGCSLHHAYGVPLLPGSGVKGVVRAFASDGTDLERAVIDELFGAAPARDAAHLTGLAARVAFHDAWWVPDSATTPLVEEVVTNHHPDYYGHEGAVAATDDESPVPNAQTAVRGAFLFIVEGEAAWTSLALELLRHAMEERGIGARTRAGFGWMRADPALHERWRALRRASLERLEAAHARRARRQADARREAQRQMLSDAQRMLLELSEDAARYRGMADAERRRERAGLIGRLNGLCATAAEWAADDRASAASLVETIFSDIGWSDPGGNAKQRRRQVAKRHALIEALRRPPS